MNNNDEINLIAQLLGQTNAQLKQIDSQIISESGNLKRNSWNPNQILKQHIVSNANSAPNFAAPPPPPQPAVNNAPVPSPQPRIAPPPPPTHTSPEIIKRLETIESNIRIILDKIESIGSVNSNLEKILEKSLKNKIKQVTLKLDESKD